MPSSYPVIARKFKRNVNENNLHHQSPQPTLFAHPLNKHFSRPTSSLRLIYIEINLLFDSLPVPAPPPQRNASQFHCFNKVVTTCRNPWRSPTSISGMRRRMFAKRQRKDQRVTGVSDEEKAENHKLLDTFMTMWKEVILANSIDEFGLC